MKIVLLGLLLTSILVQAASFEAASIKPSDAVVGSGSGVDTDGALIRMQNVTLKRFMMSAYGVPEAQILGVPKSIDNLRYDVDARADHSPGNDELMAMLQTLLAERFHLSLHHETQTLSGYELTVAKSGVKATPSLPDEGSTTNGSRGRIEAKGCPMSRLAMRLSRVLVVPVVDMTNETRKFDFTLQWTPDDMQATASVSDASDVLKAPSLFTALQEQPGLKLESRKVPVDVLVIDHAELPSEN